MTENGIQYSSTVRASFGTCNGYTWRPIREIDYNSEVYVRKAGCEIRYLNEEPGREGRENIVQKRWVL